LLTGLWNVQDFKLNVEPKVIRPQIEGMLQRLKKKIASATLMNSKIKRLNKINKFILITK
jgi:hypothetical protein